MHWPAEIKKMPMSRTIPNDSTRQLFFPYARCKSIRFSKAVLQTVGIAFGLMSTGCGQIMIRQDACKSLPVLGISDEIDGECSSSCLEGCEGDRLALMKAKLGWQGERLQGGVGRCSEKISECWYRSRIAQWAAKHREAANAPPLPKFHPIPTHPALFPELCESNHSHPIPMVSDPVIETVE